MSKKQITQVDLKRIQKATAILHGGMIPKDSFAAKVQSLLAKRGK